VPTRPWIEPPSSRQPASKAIAKPLSFAPVSGSPSHPIASAAVTMKLSRNTSAITLTDPDLRLPT